MKTDNTTQEIEIKQLKSIRESKDMTVESLAEHLKITRDFVNYIESGDFGKLGAPTFVKGHVRNYCKALGISYETVLQQIPSQFLQVQSLQTPDALGVSPLARVRRRSNHLGRYAVGTALLGMLALSFYFVWDKWTFPGQNKQTGLQLAETNSNDKKNGKNVTYSSLIPQVNLKENTSTTEQGETTGHQNDVAEEEAESSNNTPLDTNENLSATTETSAVNNAENEAQLETELSIQAKYSIQLQLSEESWVSIKAEDGSKLEHDLVQAGAYNYQSDQPLHFRIGNARNAQVKINDEVIELTEFMRKNIADFDWPKDPG